MIGNRGDVVHSAVKLIIGLIIFAAGIYWYIGTGLGAFDALKTVFIGIFGLFLIFFGLIIAWIEYEDLKWEAKEKKEVTKKAVKKKRPARKRKK